MSKIGRKPIPLGGTAVEIKGQEIHYKGKKANGVYHLDDHLKAELKDKTLCITAARKTSDTNRLWGLHRALVNNRIIGADTGFVKNLEINGLGFKAIVQGPKVQFSLGFSHKIDYVLPAGVSLEVDKTGQKLSFSSFDKDLLGHVCSDIRALRPPEPYKGTGIKYVNETIRRKAGKAKA
jgi:large subunit ribosomal protein L6